MGPIAPDQFGLWMLGFAGLMGLLSAVVTILVGIKTLRPNAEQLAITRKEAEQYATRAELIEVKGQLTEVKGTVEKTFNYLQSRMHELANQLAPIPTQIGVLVKQQERLEFKLDLGASRQEKMLALFDTKILGDKSHGQSSE